MALTQKSSGRGRSLFSRLVLLALLPVVTLALGIFLVALPRLEKQTYGERRLKTKHLVEAATSVVTFYAEQEKNGLLTREQAQAGAIAQIKAMRYDENQYFWINDLRPFMVMHPFKPELDGKDISSNVDPDGKHLFVEMVKVCKAQGEGFVDYQWALPGTDEVAPKISYVKLYEPWGWIIGSGIYVQDVEQTVNGQRLVIAVVFGILLLVTGLFVWVFAGRLSKPIVLLKKAAERMASGETNVTVAVASSDEIGDLGRAFNVMVDQINHSIEEIRTTVDRAEAAARDTEAARQEIQEQSNYLSRNVDRMLEAMERFAGGDLTVRLEAERNDEMSRLFDGFNRALENVRGILARVAESVSTTARAAARISNTAGELADASRTQNAQADEVAVAIEEMSRTIVENASSATHTAELTDQNSKAAIEGGHVVQQTVEKIQQIAGVVNQSVQTVERLGESSREIGEILQVIDEIAGQTNLLALNAAIEAARAGEQGRGFAVVADEVRKLAEKTSNATHEIERMIKAIQSETDQAVHAMHHGHQVLGEGIVLAESAGHALEEIVSGVRSTSDLISQMAAASEEQSMTSTEISRSITEISSVTAESARGVSDIARSIDELSRQAVDLQDLVSRFNLGEEAIRINSAGKVRTYH